MKNDLELKKDVLTRLELEPKIDSSALGVSVADGVVTLSGSVEDEADRVSAERAVRIIEGVKGLVDDDLQVKSARRARPKDSELQAKAAESIQWLTTVPQESLRITSRNGWLTLEGEIDFRHQAQSIEEVLLEIPGVRGIKNLLVIRAETQAA